MLLKFFLFLFKIKFKNYDYKKYANKLFQQNKSLKIEKTQNQRQKFRA